MVPYFLHASSIVARLVVLSAEQYNQRSAFESLFLCSLSLGTDNMPENAGQNGGVLCSRVGAERHWQGNDAGMMHI